MMVVVVVVVVVMVHPFGPYMPCPSTSGGFIAKEHSGAYRGLWTFSFRVLCRSGSATPWHWQLYSTES